MTGTDVLLIGTSFSAAPMLYALKSAGYRVSVCGANPSDTCVPYADRYFELDYSDPDALLDLVRRESFAYLCPSCNDYSYMSATTVADAIGFSGFDTPETAAILHNKALFRRFAADHGFPAPLACRLTHPESDINVPFPPPWLVKPVDSFSGRGVQKVTSATGLASAWTSGIDESRSSEMLVEQFVCGTLHSHSAFIAEGKIAQEFFVDEFCETYPYQVDCSNSPSRLSKAVQRSVSECIADLVLTLRLVDGLLHTQFIVNDRHFFIIECMRRCPGDLYYNLIDYSNGTTYVENFVSGFTGQPLRLHQNSELACWARHTISLRDDRIVFSYAHAIPSNDVRVFPLSESGALVRKAPYGKVAILFASFTGRKDLFRTTQKIGRMIDVNSSEPPNAGSF